MTDQQTSHHQTFTPGQRVRTIFGDRGTVREQRGRMVRLESQREPDWWHPAKLFAVEAEVSHDHTT